MSPAVCTTHPTDYRLTNRVGRLLGTYSDEALARERAADFAKIHGEVIVESVAIVERRRKIATVKDATVLADRLGVA